MSDEDLITPESAAERLNRTASQVRRYAQSRRLNSIRRGRRVLIVVDERFELLRSENNLRDGGEASPSTGRSQEGAVPTPQHDFDDAIYDDIAELKVDIARLTARVRKLERQFQ